MDTETKITEVKYVDENGNVTVLYIITDASCINGLSEAIKKEQADLLPKSGGEMTGRLDMNHNAVTNLPDAENDSDAVSKSFMETYVTEAFLGGEW